MNKITPKKYRTIIYLILTAVIMIWNEEIKSYPTIFMFNNAVQWLPYFIIGNLFGLKLSRLILDYPSKYIIVLTTLVAFIGLQAIDCNLPAYFFLQFRILAGVLFCYIFAKSHRPVSLFHVRPFLFQRQQELYMCDCSYLRNIYSLYPLHTYSHTNSFQTSHYENIRASGSIHRIHRRRTHPARHISPHSLRE